MLLKGFRGGGVRLTVSRISQIGETRLMVKRSDHHGIEALLEGAAQRHAANFFRVVTFARDALNISTLDSVAPSVTTQAVTEKMTR